MLNHRFSIREKEHSLIYFSQCAALPTVTDHEPEGTIAFVEKSSVYDQICTGLLAQGGRAGNAPILAPCIEHGDPDDSRVSAKYVPGSSAGFSATLDEPGPIPEPWSQSDPLDSCDLVGAGQRARQKQGCEPHEKEAGGAGRPHAAQCGTN